MTEQHTTPAPVTLTLEASKALPIGTEIVDARGYWKGRTHVKTSEVTWAHFPSRPEPATKRRAVEARTNNLSPGLLGVLVHVYEEPRDAPGAGRAQAAAQRVLDEQNTTPATLDPTLVKAGDTVTLNIDSSPMAVPYRPYSVRGEVHPIGESLFAGGWPIIGHPSVTLTDHQPAPEPEWALDTFADITVSGNQVRAIRQAFPGSDVGWVTIPGSAWWWDKDVTDVRPLVVIDPAVAREAIAGFASFNRDGDPDFDITGSASEILAALGIEAS